MSVSLEKTYGRPEQLIRSQIANVNALLLGFVHFGCQACTTHGVGLQMVRWRSIVQNEA